MTPESKILAYAKRRSREYGLRAIRLTMRQGAEVGWPDLIILGPKGNILFMETKVKGGKLRAIQKERAREIVEVYGHAYVAPDSVEAADAALENFAAWCVRGYDAF